MITKEEVVTVPMNVGADQVWKVISKVDGVDRWFGSMIKTCHVEGDKRFCETADGSKLVENILEINNETRTFRFSIPSQELLPVTNIVEKMIVKDGPDGAAVVEWSATFESEPENAEVAAEAFRGMWTMGLQEMETYIRSN